MSKSRHTALASIAVILQRLLEMQGLDADEYFRRAGIDQSKLTTPSIRLEIDRIDRLLELVIPQIQNPAFGLNAACCWHPANLGVLGHAWLSSSTLRTGLLRMARYYSLIGERGVVEIEELPEGIKVRFWAKRGDPAIVPVAAVMVDITMSVLLAMCRLNAGDSLAPASATLRRLSPESPDAYEAFFGCPVKFGAEENAFVLSKESSEHPLSSANKQLAAVFDKMLAEEMARLDKSDVVSRCKLAVLDSLTSGEVAAEATANQLHMSARTLQRKLAEAEITYQQLVEDTRRDLALRYIDDPHRSISDITFSLGYSQQSAFTRAFKRWTGATPSEYRNSRTSSNTV